MAMMLCMLVLPLVMLRMHLRFMCRLVLVAAMVRPLHMVAVARCLMMVRATMRML